MRLLGAEGALDDLPSGEAQAPPLKAACSPEMPASPSLQGLYLSWPLTLGWFFKTALRLASDF